MIPVCAVCRVDAVCHPGKFLNPSVWVCSRTCQEDYEGRPDGVDEREPDECDQPSVIDYYNEVLKPL